MSKIVNNDTINNICSLLITFCCYFDTYNLFLYRIKKAQIFLSIMPNPTLQELLTHPGELMEQVEALDYAMASLITRLRYEPEQLEKAIEHYEILYLLRKALKTYNTSSHGN